MASIKGMLGKNVARIPDHTIASDALFAKASGSNAYLKAALKSTTPELKQLFSANLSQMVGEHTALSELIVKKGWSDPYSQPGDQLMQSFKHAQEVLETHVTD